MIASGFSQDGGSLLAYVVSRLRPDIFSHPVWVYFGERETAVSPETIADLLGAARQLQKDDPDSACQILLIIAVHQNYVGRRAEALQAMQQILALAEQYQLDNEMAWASWGACAICFQQGDFAQAAGYLHRLRDQLREQDEWVLSNYVETVEQSLRHPSSSGTPEMAFPARSQSSSSLMRLTYDWLGQWGFSARSNIPEFQASPPATQRPTRDGNEPAPPARLAQGWRSYWGTLKRIARGELKLQWVAQDTAHRPRGKLQQTARSPAQAQDRSTPPALLQSTAPLPASPEANITLPSHPEESSVEASLLIYCLGPFRVYKNEQLIEKWPGNKCRQVLKYLVVHQATATNQEVLMELFWPEMDAKGARRNLYQAIYNLRQALQDDGAGHSYVLTEENHYRLNPELDLWVDSEAFDQHVQKAQTLMAAKRQEEAMREFQQAESLYQGEFLAEDRYEDWPLVLRENLKNAYLDALDQLSQHFYASEQFSMSIYYCRKILGEDNCREDVHRRVMLCYLSLGQPHLALRQYHSCVEALREELDVPPMPATEELYKQIRQRHR